MSRLCESFQMRQMQPRTALNFSGLQPQPNCMDVFPSRNERERRISESTVSSKAAEEIVDEFEAGQQTPSSIRTPSSGPFTPNPQMLVNMSEDSKISVENRQQIINNYYQYLQKDPKNSAFILSDKNIPTSRKALFILGQKSCWGIALVMIMIMTGFNTMVMTVTLTKDREVVVRVDIGLPEINPEVPTAQLPYTTVIATHTNDGIGTCVSKNDCIKRIKKIYDDSIANNFLDIPYNYLIGGDGLVYEGRGFRFQGENPNHDSMSNFDQVGMIIAFIGTFDDVRPNNLQIRAFENFIESSVRRGSIAANYHILSQFELLMMDDEPVRLTEMLKEFERFYSLTKVSSRLKWSAFPPRDEEQKKKFGHRQNVSVARSVRKSSRDDWCNDYESCLELMNELQSFDLETFNDIRYNFVITPHGVFEGRGWDVRPDPFGDSDYLSNGFATNDLRKSEENLGEVWEKLTRDGQVLGKMTEEVIKPCDTDLCYSST